MSLALQNILVMAALVVVLSTVLAFAREEKWHRAWSRFRRDRVGMGALIVLGLYMVIGAADLIQLRQSQGVTVSLLDRAFASVPQEKGYSAPLASSTYTVNGAEPLKGRHLLGTDALGKDVLLQALKGCRTALLIGGLTSLIYIPIGLVLGITAGYFRGWVDDLIHYIYSTLASVPNILLLVSMLLVLGKGVWQIALALGITGWIGLCRLLRGETMRQSERTYCEAARALGQSHTKILASHILPNVLHLVFINFVLGFSGIVLAESILSYLGVGMPIGTPSWGVMIDGARMELSREPAVWWTISAATGALFLLVLSLNLLGDSLRRAFDPKAS